MADGDVLTKVAGHQAFATPGGLTMTLSASDPGAVGAGNLWLELDPSDNQNSPQLHVRKANNAGWHSAGIADKLVGGSQAEWSIWDGDGNPISDIEMLATGGNGSIRFIAQSAGGSSPSSNVFFLRDRVELDVNPAIGPSKVYNFDKDNFTIGGEIVGTQAAHVADGSTVDQLRDALIASGLMAAS